MDTAFGTRLSKAGQACSPRTVLGKIYNSPHVTKPLTTRGTLAMSASDGSDDTLHTSLNDGSTGHEAARRILPQFKGSQQSTAIYMATMRRHGTRENSYLIGTGYKLFASHESIHRAFSGRIMQCKRWNMDTFPLHTYSCPLGVIRLSCKLTLMWVGSDFLRLLAEIFANRSNPPRAVPSICFADRSATLSIPFGSWTPRLLEIVGKLVLGQDHPKCCSSLVQSILFKSFLRRSSCADCCHCAFYSKAVVTKAKQIFLAKYLGTLSKDPGWSHT